MNWHLLLAFILAALLPIALIATGIELRRVRLRIVLDLRDTVFKDLASLPQLDLAIARYDRARETATPGTTSGIPPRTGRQDEVKQWAGAAIYMLVCMAGFTLLFDPVQMLLHTPVRAPGVGQAIFWLPEPRAGQVHDLLHRSASIAGFAFLGGYVFNIRYLIRQTLNQELSALAFVRAALRHLQGVFIAVAAYHFGATILPDAASTAGITFALSLAVAFVIGYFPDLGLARIAQVARAKIKAIDEHAFEKARIVPLEIIDGIDHEIAFRLQESNLFDVQNLAVANPIELYAETPYPLLQIFDWVLQAQLCLVVGSRAFTELKLHKVRTIFDLERAMLSVGAPEPYLHALAGVLLSDATPRFRSAIGLPADAAAGNVPATAQPLVLRHIVAVMSDDLHIHRLRSLWQAILKATRGATDDGKPLWLFDVGPLPGDPEFQG